MKSKIILFLTILLTSCTSTPTPTPTQIPSPTIAPTFTPTPSLIIPPTTIPTFIPTQTSYPIIATRTNPTIAVTPLPNYLWGISPGPGTTYSIEEYKILAPSKGWGATLPCICFIIFPVHFMEPDDFPTADEWISNNVKLIIDQMEIDDYHALFLTNLLGGTNIDSETGEIIWKAPDGEPLRVCYALPLELGFHKGTIIVEKTSGEQISYSWKFEITNE
jgi:hypothetical protein